MRAICIDIEHFLEELGEPPDEKLVNLVVEMGRLKEKHVLVINQPIDYPKGLADKLLELNLDNCCTLLNGLPESGSSLGTSYQQKLAQHLSIEYGVSDESSRSKDKIKYFYVPRYLSLKKVLEQALAAQLRGEPLVDLNDIVPDYRGSERISYSARLGFRVDAEKTASWKQYWKVLVIFCLSLLFAIAMALLVASSLPVGKAFALAFSMSHLGVAALAVSTAFLMLAFCLALTLLIYAAVCVWRKRNDLCCCRALDQAMQGQARGTPTSSLQLPNSSTKESPGGSMVSVPATPLQLAHAEVPSASSLSLT